MKLTNYSTTEEHPSLGQLRPIVIPICVGFEVFPLVFLLYCNSQDVYEKMSVAIVCGRSERELRN